MEVLIPVLLQATDERFNLRRRIEVISRSHLCNVNIVWCYLKKEQNPISASF